MKAFLFTALVILISIPTYACKMAPAEISLLQMEETLRVIRSSGHYDGHAILALKIDGREVQVKSVRPDSGECILTTVIVEVKPS